MALLRRAFRLGVQATPRKVNPAALPSFPMLPENNVRQGFLLPDQYGRLLEELPPELRPLLVVGYHVGCRRGELLPMRKEQVDLQAKQITLYPGTTKNSEGRTLPIYGEMLPVLTEQMQALKEFPKCRWLFHRNGRRIRSFRASWRLACERAGLPGLLFHDLRRSAVRNMRRAGISEKIARAISGHKTREVFDRYDIVDTADLEQAGAKLEEFLKGWKKG
jgi:integrase